jgi:hypothetical protein
MGNHFDPSELVLEASSFERTETELVMNGQITDTGEQIDRNTGRSICDAVGERLKQSLRPDTSRLSPYLQHLMDELRRRDSEDRQKLPS